MRKERLMIPGPTMIPPKGVEAMGRPMINHRGVDFHHMYQRVQMGLQQVLGTVEDVLVFPGAGTGGMEALLVNLFSPDDQVLILETGVFGRRFADIAAAFGLVVQTIAFPMGEGIDLAVLHDHLAKDENHSIQAVIMTQNETSTGVSHEVDAVRKAMADHPALLLVDGVSSVGAMDFQMDAWRVDGVVTGSQKALMTAPGLTIVALSQNAWARTTQASLPRYYWDFARARTTGKRGETPYTPAIPQWMGLDSALQLMLAEGLDVIYQRQKKLGLSFRAGIHAMGLHIVAHPPWQSDTVTALWVPDGVDTKAWQHILSAQYGIETAGGQGPLAGQIIRIGHMGYVDILDIIAVLGAMEMSLASLGDFRTGGVAAAQTMWIKGGTCQ